MTAVNPHEEAARAKKRDQLIAQLEHEGLIGKVDPGLDLERVRSLVPGQWVRLSKRAGCKEAAEPDDDRRGVQRAGGAGAVVSAAIKLEGPCGPITIKPPTAQALNASAIEWLDMMREDLAELELRVGHGESTRALGSKISRVVTMLIEQKALIDAEKAGL